MKRVVDFWVIFLKGLSIEMNKKRAIAALHQQRNNTLL